MAPALIQANQHAACSSSYPKVMLFLPRHGQCCWSNSAAARPPPRACRASGHMPLARKRETLRDSRQIRRGFGSVAQKRRTTGAPRAGFRLIPGRGGPDFPWCFSVRALLWFRAPRMGAGQAQDGGADSAPDVPAGEIPPNKYGVGLARTKKYREHPKNGQPKEGASGPPSHFFQQQKKRSLSCSLRRPRGASGRPPGG